jgi:8-oxo-dGTP pyrophosphatase MutT (NUDIX family)
MNDHRKTVIHLLDTHVASDDEERRDVAFIRAFVMNHPQCFGKADTAGHITGSAFVIDSEKRVLMTFHRKLQRWLQLGGHGLPHELDPADTALREAHEESGLQRLEFHPQFERRPVDIDCHMIPGRSNEPAHPHLDFRYILTTDTPEAIEISDESSALEWLDRRALENMDFDPALHRALRKIWAV